MAKALSESDAAIRVTLVPDAAVFALMSRVNKVSAAAACRRRPLPHTVAADCCCRPLLCRRHRRRRRRRCRSCSLLLLLLPLLLLRFRLSTQHPAWLADKAKKHNINGR